MPGIYIETFGCQMNEADSQYIAERALGAGYTIATDPREAAVVVLNTCTVRDNAETRAYGRMHHFKVLKEADPAMKIVVAGCLAEQDKDRMQGLVPHIDAVFGTKELVKMGDAIVGWRDDFSDDEVELGSEKAVLDALGGRADCVTDAFTHLRAFVTVQRGCSYYCTFCIVPHVRGRFDHRPIGEILDEVRGRLREGAREITLVGQTVNAYKDPGTGADFADLLETVAVLPGLERLTFVTSHPRDVSEKLVRTMASLPNLNPRFHLPMQCGSSPILRRMNRKYTIEQYRATIDLFREHCRDWALTTDLIVAFPGESEEDFVQTLVHCEQLAFAQAYMFIYSPRRGTPASNWEQIPAAVGSERLKRLQAVIDASVRAYHARKVGTTVRALVQGPSRRDPARLHAKLLDNVSFIAPVPPGTTMDDYATTPWIDVAIDASTVSGVSGTIVGRAERFTDVATPVAKPVVDLLTLA